MSIIENRNDQKLRGGYYTPYDIAFAISKWAITQKNIKVLEPSFGGGAFLKATAKVKRELGETYQQIVNNIHGIEINQREYEATIDQLTNDGYILENIYCQDFFEWYQCNTGLFSNSTTYNVIIGNPPFIRYQNFPEPSRSLAINQACQRGVCLNRLTNMWVPFVILSAELLEEGGRLGMVVPAELLQVSYAGSLRKYLTETFRSITIYSCNELFFANAEQEVVVLLAEDKTFIKHSNANVRIIQTQSKAELINSITSQSSHSTCNYFSPSSEKWTKFFLAPKEIDFIHKLYTDNKIVSFGSYFSVDVGVVTGRNDFFVINKDTAIRYDLMDFVRPVIGRSSQITSPILNKQEWQSLWDEGRFVGLLDLNNLSKDSIPHNVLQYLSDGIAAEVNKGYKCSIRKEWYKVPSIWAPDAFLFRQIHDFPHLVFNKANAVSTDTIHRVRKLKKQRFPQTLFYTFLTALSAEIEGRSYGGGVLELEPSEAEKLLVPNPALFNHRMINYSISRDNNMEFLKQNSYLLLQDILGFSSKDINLLESAYSKMFERRKNRKKKSSIVGGKPLYLSK